MSSWTGADAKFSLTADGFSACVGFGFGGGGTSLSVDPFGDLDDNGVTLEAKVKDQLGPGKVEVGFDLGECAKFNPKAEACAGPFCSKLSDKPNLKIKGKAEALSGTASC